MLTATAALLFCGTPAYAADEPDKLTIMSDEQYQEMLDRHELRPAPAHSTPRTTDSTVAAAGPSWAAVKFNSKDKSGRVVPTRAGNSALGWKHFSGRHNITDPDVIKQIINNTGSPTKNKEQPNRLVYDGALVKTSSNPFVLPRKIANIRIIVQYHWRTADKQYSLTDKKAKIGVITAYCRNVARNRCPDGVNQT
ncbi:hypothetical protein [Streptomyces roseolus]|uniref:hypothetical protein n=1 Tax=Streptomyces roseolus TaxID=67358 RepID=UPI00167589E2|nr:hypothetical protein [Streptomyces roseolus]